MRRHSQLSSQLLMLASFMVTALFFLQSASTVSASTLSVDLHARLPTLVARHGNDRLFREVQDYYERQEAAEEMTATVTELPTAAVSVAGQPLPTTAYAHDPLLALMPDFAFSMPAQIVVTGINIALVAVLVIHLLFTVQYHFPLSKKNFYLQISGSTMLLISLSVTLHIILTQLEAKSQNWPYMFPYIGVQVPPGDESWTMVQEVFYLLMRAVTTALINLTHIQFLTLLFPSALEARLILWMLGPMAIVASGMEFTALSSDDDFKTSDLGDAIRNICNSTLTLLYTLALLIWGLLVNRRRAWRAGGGTAAFGGGSVGLAFINTAINFTEIKYDRLWWLPNVCWTLTIWQSWLGFWWWVSSGMGIGEVEDRQARLEKKRKREARRKRKVEKQRRKLAGLTDDEDGAEEAAGSQVLESIPGLNGIRRFKDRLIGETNGNTLTRRTRRPTIDSDMPSAGSALGAEAIELRRVAVSQGDQREELDDDQDGKPDPEGLTSISVVGEEEQAQEDRVADDGRTTAGTGSGSSDTNPTTAASSAPPGWLSMTARRFMESQPNFIKARFRRLRMAHVAAARRAASEQSALRDQVLNSSRNPGPGLRHMMFDRPSSLREEPESGAQGSGGEGGSNSRRVSANVGRSVSLSTPMAGTGGRQSRGAQIEAGTNVARSSSNGAASGQPSGSDPLARVTSDEASFSNDTSMTKVSHRSTSNTSTDSYGGTPNGPRRSGTGPFTDDSAVNATSKDDDWEDEVVTMTEAVSDSIPRRRGRGDSSHVEEGDEDDEDPSWFWRGGLRQMRLRDRTRYD